MKYLVTASEMRRFDGNMTERIGIPACVLMERAALAAAEAAEEFAPAGAGARHALIMAGCGNNGGDGLALARLLSERGYEAEVLCVGNRERTSDEWKRQMEILKNYPVKFTDTPQRKDYAVLADALLGVGLKGNVRGEYAEAIELFNRLEGWKLALDIPSGICSDTGKVSGRAVKADMTVTFGFCKRGLVLYPGREYAGEVRVRDAGITERSFFGEEPEMYALDGEAEALMPRRKGDGNKGTFGKVLLIAGSAGMAGAAVLAAKAAYRAGAGMVKVITPAENRIILQQAVPEALSGTEEDLGESMKRADVIAVGPGLGKGERALSCLNKCIRESRKPLLADADALNLLSVQPELRALLASQGAEGREIILTPHPGEMARLTGKSVEECREDLPGTGRALAAELHAVVAAKDAVTFICGEKGRICANLSGNSGMATAGSGDVLTGVIAAFAAQGEDAFTAAATGVYVHGRAGDKTAAERGEHSCMAGDIAEAI